MLPRYRWTLAVLAFSLCLIGLPGTIANSDEGLPSQRITQRSIQNVAEKEVAQESKPQSTEGQSNDEQECSTLIDAPTVGHDAQEKLGKKFFEAAQLNNKSETEFEDILSDDASWLDTCGRTFYVEPLPEQIPPPVLATATPRAITASSSAIALHSRPGSPITLYLDFNPRLISGTAWNSTYNLGNPWTTTGFSLDGDYSTFSVQDQTAILSIWQRVAEDYAPFNVDVTTELPAAGILERSSSTDLIYGSRVQISDDSLIQSSCGCGGLSYVGVANMTGTNHELYQPAWVFSAALGHNIKYIAEAVSHEAGHSFGLSHEGTTTSAYYTGANGWAPIMGVGYYQSLTQWSTGDYPAANNLENEYSIFSAYGLKPAADEDANTALSGLQTWVGNTSAGVISAPTDKDYFQFIPSATGTFTFTAVSGTTTQNLDIRMDILGSDGSTILATANPTFNQLTTESADGLSAVTSINLSAGVKYFIQLDGVGYLTSLTGGYSDYGSVGSYSLTVSGPVAPLAISAPVLNQGSLGTPYSSQLSASGGYPQYSWSATGLPTGLNISPTGLISGTPSVAGNFPIVITVLDSQSNSSTFSGNVLINDRVLISTTSLVPGVISRSYSAQLIAQGGSGTYTWSATGLPTGLTVSTTGLISGLPTVSGSFTTTFKATDSLGLSAQSNILWSINPKFAITTTSLPAANLLINYSSQIVVAGGIAPLTITASGLPAGISMSPTGLISGIPTVLGSYPVLINVTDAGQVNITSTLILSVANKLSISAATLPSATLNATYSYQFLSSGGTAPYTFTGATIPTGLTLSTAGLLTGKPTRSGNSTFTVTVKDASGATASSSFVLTVVSPLAISTSTLASGVTNTLYSTTLTSTGGTLPNTWSSSVLPLGLNFSTTGVLSGTPTVAGTFTISFSVTDSTATVVTKSLSLTVLPQLVITSTSLPNAQRNVSYSFSLLATGGTTARSWSRTAGTLPSGITLSTSGVISGIATTAGTYNFTVKVVSGTQNVSINLTLKVV